MKSIYQEISNSGIDMSSYINNFDEQQLREILMGIEKGLDVSKYADPKYDSYQMHEIRLGLEKGLDVTIYANPKYDWKQMGQIRLGLEEN